MTLSAPPLATGFRRYVPGLASIVEGARTSALADTRGALTVWAIVVPQSLAYATLAGVPSEGGRYSSVYPIQDGTGRLLVSWSQCRVQDVVDPAIDPPPPVTRTRRPPTSSRTASRSVVRMS